VTLKSLHLVTHANFTALCVIEADVRSITSMPAAYVLERRFTKFGEITQSKGHYAVQG